MLCRYFMIEVMKSEEDRRLGKMPNEAPTIQFISDEESYLEDEDSLYDMLDEFNEFETVKITKGTLVIYILAVGTCFTN